MCQPKDILNVENGVLSTECDSKQSVQNVIVNFNLQVKRIQIRCRKRKTRSFYVQGPFV